MISNHELYQQFAKERTAKEIELMESIIQFMQKIPEEIKIWKAKDGKSDKTYDLAFKAFGKRGPRGGPSFVAFLLYSENRSFNKNKLLDSLIVQFRFKGISKKNRSLSEIRKWDTEGRLELANQDWWNYPFHNYSSDMEYFKGLFYNAYNRMDSTEISISSKAEAPSISEYLPTKSDCEMAVETLINSGKDGFDKEEVIDWLSAYFSKNKIILKNNWRIITQRNIDIWHEEEQ
jgi:hypothetical protein